VATTSTPGPSTSADYDAIVVAGARSERLGGVDKASLDVGGSSLLSRAVAAVGEAATVTVVGPVRVLDVPVLWCEEAPAGGGPVAAFAAGLAGGDASTIVLIAADLPFIAGAVEVLVSALGSHDVAVLVDSSGRANYLASAWRRPVAVASVAGDVGGRSMRSLMPGLDVVEVLDSGDWGMDCDTWEAVAAARARVGKAL
jgi:molybdopterin-guanine dinucleotide biosynthesis protein A